MLPIGSSRYTCSTSSTRRAICARAPMAGRGGSRRRGGRAGGVERVLARLQEFDPPGVFARDLPECLALQLRDRNRLDPAMRLLLDNLPLLAARNAPALLRICGVDAEDLAEMVAEIKSLDPRPG